MKSNTPSTLSSRLTHELERARMKPSQLARECGVSAVSVHKWISGKTKQLQDDTLLKVAAIFHVNWRWLKTGEGPRAGMDNSDYHDIDVLAEARRCLEESKKAMVEMQRELELRQQQTDRSIAAISAVLHRDVPPVPIAQPSLVASLAKARHKKRKSVDVA